MAPDSGTPKCASNNLRRIGGHDGDDHIAADTSSRAVPTPGAVPDPGHRPSYNADRHK